MGGSKSRGGPGDPLTLKGWRPPTSAPPLVPCHCWGQSSCELRVCPWFSILSGRSLSLPRERRVSRICAAADLNSEPSRGPPPGGAPRRRAGCAAPEPWRTREGARGAGPRLVCGRGPAPCRGSRAGSEEAAEGDGELTEPWVGDGGFLTGPGLLLSTSTWWRRGGLRPRGCCRGREAVRKPGSAGPVLETGRAGPRSPRGDSRTFVAATSPPAPRARTPRAPCAERGRGGLLCPGRPERRIPGATGPPRPGAAGRGQGSSGAPVCAQFLLLLGTPRTTATRQAPLSVESSTQEFRRGLPSPPPVDCPWSSIYPASYRRVFCVSRWQAESLTLEPPEKP